MRHLKYKLMVERFTISLNIKFAHPNIPPPSKSPLLSIETPALDLRVEICFKRKAEKVSTNRKERSGMKGRDILLRYPKAKAEKLMASLKERGLWYYDPDFDKDEEDCMFVCLPAILGAFDFIVAIFGL